MRKGYLSPLFEQVAVRRLSLTELDPETSRSHEFQGSKALVELLGTNDGGEKRSIKTQLVFLADYLDEPLKQETRLTWSQVRRKSATRKPEYRLYYPQDAKLISSNASPGDLLLLARHPDGRLTALIVDEGSRWEQDLIWLFNLTDKDPARKIFVFQDVEGNPPSQLRADMILEAIGIEAPTPAPAPSDLEEMLNKWPEDVPKVAVFSKFARSKCKGINVLADPDAALWMWTEEEHRLYRLYEAHQIGKAIQSGFVNQNGTPDVDHFLEFAKSMQQRRFSRVGTAFQEHTLEILKAFGLRYKPQAITEAKRMPDFLLPGMGYYHDPLFSADLLFMLALKRTVRERFTQIQSEANRIKIKHLLTLDRRMTSDQMEEITRLGLQLVVPEPVRLAYPDEASRSRMMTVRGFIELMQEKQRNLPDEPPLSAEVLARMNEARKSKKKTAKRGVTGERLALPRRAGTPKNR